MEVGINDKYAYVKNSIHKLHNYLKGEQAQNRPTDYVFSILLKEDLIPMQIEHRKHKTLRRFNKEFKEIARIQGVEQNVTSYVIRHSFATNLKFVGILKDIIGKSMGHADVSLT